MGCKTFKRRCGLLVFLAWFLFAACLLKRNLQFGFPADEGRRIRKELRMRTGDPRTIETFSCPQDYETALKGCAKLRYDSLGPLAKASIIISFHNDETISSLLHTVHSIVQRTPKQLIEEIIIIDDYSQKDDFRQILEIYLKTVFKSCRVHLHRNSANLGLIRSRLKGSRLSKGEVLVFMDSHSEVQTGWLEPLLFEIKKNRRSLVSSVIDWMEKTPDNQWTYKYGCAPDSTIIYDWSMGFGWSRIPREDIRPTITDAHTTKTIVGAYIAIEKEFFREIGELDDGMQFWGAENIDLSIRVWLFDGQVLTVPCSRAAHLEGRNTRSYRNAYYSVVKQNYKRLVEVWFDEYKDCFYFYFPEMISVDVGDLSERLKVKASAPHSFKWYLQNIYPELGCPVKDALARGPVKNLETGQCLTAANLYTMTTECADKKNNQRMYWSNRFHLRQPNYVLHENEGGGEKRVMVAEYVPFYRNDGASKWIHWKDGPLMDLQSRLCLEASSNDTSSKKAYVSLRSCNFLENATRQTWRFHEYTDQYDDLMNNQSKNVHGREQQALLDVYHLHG